MDRHAPLVDRLRQGNRQSTITIHEYVQGNSAIEEVE